MNGLSDEKGQAIFLAAGLLLLFVGLGAVVLNIGWWLHDKRDAQNDVDASVLAGAQKLPDESAASQAAGDWAGYNGVDVPANLDCCQFEDHTGDGLADLIRATVHREPGSLQKGLVDIGTVTIRATAAAARMRAVASCVPPWGVKPPDPGDQTPTDTYWGLDPTQLYVFHESEFMTPGNFGALRLYGQGKDCYAEAIQSACGNCKGGCANGEQIWFDGTLQCTTEPGLGGEKTCAALDGRYGGGCHSGQTLDCDAATYADAVTLSRTAACSDRKLPIPIIDDWPPQGTSAPIHILGLATFYIAGWDREPPWGQDTVAPDAMVWGYFLEGEFIDEAWKIVWDYSDDPFAPIKILLVE